MQPKSKKIELQEIFAGSAEEWRPTSPWPPGTKPQVQNSWLAKRNDDRAKALASAERRIDTTSPNPWGLPNWRDKKAYSTTGTEDQWRWEFIRRSQRYRALWMSMQTERDANPNADLSNYRRSVRAGLNLPLISPSVSKDHEIFHWLNDKDEADASDLRCLPLTADIKLIKRWLKSVSDSGHILAHIDPWQPISPQLADISDQLAFWLDLDDERQANLGEDRRPTKVSRDRSDKYPLYLRLLDARDRESPDHTTIAKIAIAFDRENHPFDVGEDSIKRIVRQARRVQASFVGELSVAR